MLIVDGVADLKQFDIVGTCADANHRRAVHVAISEGRVRCALGKHVSVSHCGPPFYSDPHEESNTRLDIYGRVTNLTDDEIKILKLRRQQVCTQMTSQKEGLSGLEHYYIKPVIKKERDAETNRIIKLRFSCVGYVLHLYEAIGIEFVRENESLPLVSFDFLSEEYPRFPAAVLKRYLPKLGLVGNGPWRVLLASYVVKSLQRSDDEIRSGPLEFSSLQDG